MKTHTTEALSLLNRRRYGRTNFITAVLGGSAQNRRRELGKLYKEGYLNLHSPNGTGAIERAYPHYFFRIFERSPKSDRLLEAHQITPLNHKASSLFWHQVMIDDLLLSIEAACKRAGLVFKDKHEIIAERPLTLPCEIYHRFDGGHTETYKGALHPDALFSIDGQCFVLEADRHKEPINANKFKDKTSYLRKLLQYAHVFRNRVYEREWGINSLRVLNITTNHTHKKEIMDFMRDRLKAKSRSLLFAAYPGLASSDKSPTPILSILTDPMERVGHEPLTIMETLHGRQT